MYHKCMSSKYLISLTELKKNWTDTETRLLVTLRIEDNTKFVNSKYNHTVLWNSIQRKMKEKGYKVSSIQCSNKWKSLKREYTSVIDHNNCTGVEPKTCRFMDEFNQLYGDNPKTKPKVTISSTDEPESDNDNSDVNFSASGDSETTPGRKKRKNSKGGVIDWLNSYAEKQDEKEHRTETIVKEMHNDQMQRFDRLLNILDRSQQLE